MRFFFFAASASANVMFFCLNVDLLEQTSKRKLEVVDTKVYVEPQVQLERELKKYRTYNL